VGGSDAGDPVRALTDRQTDRQTDSNRTSDAQMVATAATAATAAAAVDRRNGKGA